jgi:hypothetical protein
MNNKKPIAEISFFNLSILRGPSILKKRDMSANVRPTGRRLL